MTKKVAYLLFFLFASVTSLKALAFNWEYEREVDYYLSFMGENYPKLKGGIEYLLGLTQIT